MTLALNQTDRAMLAGDEGAGTALAMRLVVRAAEATGADQLIDIAGAHVDSCLDHGQASVDFIDRLVDGGAHVRVPTTLNIGALDLLHPELWGGDADLAARGRRVMDGYRALGARPTFTCAPYQLSDARPAFGVQVAWGESNAIVFCNSVLGARTNRYGDFLDAAAAITGRVPAAGLHLDEGRRARLVLRIGADVPARLLDADDFYPVLGLVLGRRAGARVAVLTGLPDGLSEDRLKAIGAAAASSGAVAMFHAVGSTPEAPTLDAALGGRHPDETFDVGLDELRAARAELTTATEGTPLSAVALGTPHASLRELGRIADLLAGDPVASGVVLMVSTARDTLATPEGERVASRLRTAGVDILVDTCSYIAPVLRVRDGAVMTDSAKWAYYAPGNLGFAVAFGSTAACVRSAVEGRLVTDDSIWGTR